MLSFLFAILLASPILMLRLESSSFDKPLSKEEERMYLERVAQGDTEARNILIVKNMRLVAHMAKRYWKNDDERDDFIQIGSIGLIQAVKTYKLSKDIAFSTYASTCIDNEIKMYLRRTKNFSREVSLDERLDSGEDDTPLLLGDLLKVDDDMNEGMIFYEAAKKLHTYLDEGLDDTERKIIISRYGLYGSKIKKQRELAKDLGISRSYVSRIEKRSVSKLIQLFKKDKYIE